MKTVIFIFAIGLLICQNGKSQTILENDIPIPVRVALYSKYPELNIKGAVVWRSISDQYFALFNKQNLNCMIIFSDQGKWIETSTEMNPNKLPKSMQEYLLSSYANWQISKLEMVKTFTNRIFYRVVIDNADESLLVILPSERLVSDL